MTSISLWSSHVRPAVTNHLNPQPRSSQHPALRSIHHCAAVLGSVNQSASERLFADAAREEGGESNGAASEEGTGSTSKSTQLESQHQNWTGEESMQDAVLRMLVDKYKPLQLFGSIRTADQKLKESPPQVRQSAVSAHAAVSTPARPWQEIADAPLLPSIEGHRPWHTTFKAPSHAAASIKLGNFAPSSARSSAGPDDSYERTKRTEREPGKRKQQARRLSHARESTLDYRLGLRDGGTGDRQISSRINPVTLKGWQSLIEDRIEVQELPVCLILTHSVIDTESTAFGPVRPGERQEPANRAAERGGQSVHCRGGVSHESNSAAQWCRSSVGRSPNGLVIHDLASVACKLNVTL